MRSYREFIACARSYKDVLKHHPSKGIALTRGEIKYVWEDAHRSDVNYMFPLLDFEDKVRLSYNEFLSGIMLATEDEIFGFLSGMRDLNIAVVDPIVVPLKCNEGVIRRIPSLIPRYDTLQYDASCYSSSSQDLIVGRGMAVFDQRRGLLAWRGRGETVSKPNFNWEVLVRREEVKTLCSGLDLVHELKQRPLVPLAGMPLTVMARGLIKSVPRPLELPLSNLSFLNLVGDNELVSQMGSGVVPIPDAYYEEFAQVYLRLKEFKGYCFSHEMWENNAVPDYLAHTYMRIERSDPFSTADIERGLEKVLSKNRAAKTSYRIKRK